MSSWKKQHVKHRNRDHEAGLESGSWKSSVKRGEEPNGF